MEWASEEKVGQILKEEIDLKYSAENLPIRLMFSKYFRFQEDKKQYPNLFCWFGYHATSENKNIDIKIVDLIYKKHHALFVDAEDGEIKPTIFEGRTKENIANSFNYFYKFNIHYDMILKWISEEGVFNLDYKWLAKNRADSFIPSIKEEFTKQFGISIDEISIV